MVRHGQETTVIAAIAAELSRIQWASIDTEPRQDIIDDAESVLDYIEKNLLPSGSGVDSGTQIDRDKSNPGKIVLSTSYHHMDEGGCYDGWTEHTVIVTPSFSGFDLRITGRNRNDIKDYLGDRYYHALAEKIVPTYDEETEERGFIVPSFEAARAVYRKRIEQE